MTLAVLDPKVIHLAVEADPILKIMATVDPMHTTEVTSPAAGYFIGGLNSPKSLERVTLDEWPEFGDDGPESYGVCDSPDQFIEKFGDVLRDDARTLAVFFTLISKASQSPDGGWRWHKWGEYVGNLNPQHEYLFDEDDSIQNVYTFHIVELEARWSGGQELAR